MATEVQIPKTHKAAVYDNPGNLSIKIEQVETPEPGPGEVLVNLTHSGVCHSDFGLMMNSWKHLPVSTPAGQVGGHEGVGVVVKMGPSTESSPVKLGDRVGIKWVSSACLHCEPCLSGAEGCCLHQKISGFFVPGTFQQYTLAPANYVTPIPDTVPSDIAAPLLCGGTTVYAALKKSRAQPGDWVVVSGAGGGLGHLACQIGGLGMGFRILGIDMVDKKEFVMGECGAEKFLALNDFERGPEGDKKIVEAVKEATGGAGAHAVIVCTAANAAYSQAVEFLRFNGTVVVVGIPEGTPVPIQTAYPFKIMSQQLTITGSAVGNRKEAIETMKLASRGVVTTKFKLYSLEHLAEIFRLMERGELLGRAVLVLD